MRTDCDESAVAASGAGTLRMGLSALSRADGRSVEIVVLDVLRGEVAYSSGSARTLGVRYGRAPRWSWTCSTVMPLSSAITERERVKNGPGANRHHADAVLGDPRSPRRTRR